MAVHMEPRTKSSEAMGGSFWLLLLSALGVGCGSCFGFCRFAERMGTCEVSAEPQNPVRGTGRGRCAGSKLSSICIVGIDALS